MSAATAAACSPNTSATTTLAPSWAKRRASASPMPCAAPVTIATLSSRRMVSSSFKFKTAAGSCALMLTPNRSSHEKECFDDRRKRKVQIPGQCRLGEIARRLVLQGGRWCRRRQQRQRLCVQSGRAPDDGVRPRGQFPASWGEGQYPRAHGVHMAPDDTMFLTDDGGHFVRKVTHDGKVLLDLGVPGKPAPYMSGEPFHRCTHTALSPQGEIYVSDGYGNARVHKYSPDGKLLMSWGEPGTGEGEFNIVHNICCDADGWVYVADRENHRVQVFDGNGKYETQWKNLHRPCGLYMPYGHKPTFYVGEVGPAAAVSRD